MKRLKLFLMILVLIVLMAAVVVFRSPYASVVSGPVDIEALWAIEDTRVESEEPLVTKLLNHGIPLAYDKNENLFYCSLGLENGDVWPELHLTAPEAQGVKICFSDDYTYDWCNEAIAEGYTYELMAYTDTEYAYFYMVFTGLPIVSLAYEGEMTTEDIPVSFEMGSTAAGSLVSPGRAHLRGDSTLEWAKKGGYRVEFTRRVDGTGKVEREIPGFAVEDALLLLPMAFDDTLMLDRLSWEMYRLITPDKQAFSARKTQYVELFVNSEYYGVFLMMTPFDIAEELAKEGSHALLSDSVYRTVVTTRRKDRPVIDTPQMGYELFYTGNQNRPFDALENYLALWNEEDDDVFRELAHACVDIDSAVRYMMFAEAVGLADNSKNNLYIWSHEVDGRQRYRFKPWDMDRSWGIDALHDFEGWFAIPVVDRLVNLDVGHARSRLYDVWQEMKEKGFTYETVEVYTAQYMEELNASGAFLRNANRWGLNASMAEASKILAYCGVRFGLLDEVVERICATDERIDFLSVDLRSGDPVVNPMVDFSRE